MEDTSSCEASCGTLPEDYERQIPTFYLGDSRATTMKPHRPEVRTLRWGWCHRQTEQPDRQRPGQGRQPTVLQLAGARIYLGEPAHQRTGLPSGVRVYRGESERQRAGLPSGVRVSRGEAERQRAGLPSAGVRVPLSKRPQESSRRPKPNIQSFFCQQKQ